ncbi:MAG: hypothetical protein JWP22_4375 [Ramlibacter sp.]|nr:hypothetical protein [Ramlibacter sp.]MDB5915700.1 hypothetical protein [Ramlibacter sp.]
MKNSPVLLHAQDGVAVLALSRPHVMNANHGESQQDRARQQRP